MEETVIIYENLERDAIAKSIETYDYVENTNMFVVDGDHKTKLTTQFKEEVKDGKVKIFTVEEMQRTLNKKELKFSELEQVKYNFDYLKNNYFLVAYNNTIEMSQIEKKEVESKFTLKNINAFFQTHCGNFFGFIKNKTIKIYAGEDFYLYYSLEMDDEIVKCSFTKNDQYLIVETEKDIFAYEFDTCKETCVIDKDNVEMYQFYIFEDVQYINLFLNDKSNKLISLKDNTEKKFENFSESEHKFYSKNEAFVEIFKLKNQHKLITNHTSKLYANVEEFKVLLVERETLFGRDAQKVYVYVKKNIKDVRNYALEIIQKDKISSLSIKKSIKEFTAINEGCVVQYEDGEMEIFVEGDYTYKSILKVRKVGTCLVKLNYLNGTLYTAVFDSREDKLEMYQNERRVALFTHKKCTDMKWSPCGLYIAVFSEEASAGGMLQVFSIDGKVLYKQIYTRLSQFEWREYNLLSKTEIKEKLKSYTVAEDEISSDAAGLDVEKYAVEWINYLKSF